MRSRRGDRHRGSVGTRSRREQAKNALEASLSLSANA
jgi:hypothetical protein